METMSVNRKCKAAEVEKEVIVEEKAGQREPFYF